MTDLVTFILSIYFIALGAYRGFMNSLTVPFSIIVSTLLAIVYYKLTKDILISLVLGIIGPVLLNLLLKSLLKTWAKVTNTEIKPNALSRLGGAFLTLAWGWVFICFALILLAVLPPWGKTMIAVQHDVKYSASYFFAKPLGEKLFAIPPQNTPTAANQSSSSDDAKSLAEDPRFQKILQDPDIQKEIEAHDMVRLMSNPKMIDLVQQIMSDPATMKKVMAIYSTQANSEESKTAWSQLSK